VKVKERKMVKKCGFFLGKTTTGPHPPFF